MDIESPLDTAMPIIGMVHLPPLPGSPKYDPDSGREWLHDSAHRDAIRLADGGVDALLVENYGDIPFYPGEVPSHTIAEMTALTRTVQEATDLPTGVNVLRNDGPAAVAVAAATNADFVRVNVHVGARVTDQGIMEGQAHETMRLREQIDADVAVLSDIDVKHSTPLSSKIDDRRLVVDATKRGLANGILVSGSRTGMAIDPEEVRRVINHRDALGITTPVFVGSGVTAETVGDLLMIADGVVVGTAFKQGGETSAPVSEEKVRELVEQADMVR